MRSYANLVAAAVDRLRVIDELKERERHYRALSEHIPQIPWTADSTGQLIHADHRWKQLTGLSDEQTLKEGLSAAAHPDHKDEMAAAWRYAVEHDEPFDLQVRLLTAQYRFQWFRIQAYPSNESAGPGAKWYGTVEDIQERRDLEEALREWAHMLETRVAERTTALEAEQRERIAAEEQLRQSQKMEAVGQLTGGLAHDFNNLLAGISGSLELIRVRLRQNRVDDLDRFIDAALSSTQRAAALTHRLLAFSRQQTLEPKAVDVNRLVGSLEDMIQRAVGPSITLITTLSAGPSPIRCDPNQLENAILNLALNACDAMPNGGKLSIGTSDTIIDAAAACRHDVAPGKYVRVTVTDSGTGMPPEVQKRAFDPFFTTKPLGAGTGLGLSMIYGFAKQSRGQARIHSVVGVGTTVSIYLPLYEGDADLSVHHATNQRVSPATAGETIVLVDDEPIVRLTCAEHLRDLGYTVLEADDAASALRIFEDIRTSIDCLITDVGLPGG